MPKKPTLKQTDDIPSCVWLNNFSCLWNYWVGQRFNW